MARAAAQTQHPYPQLPPSAAGRSTKKDLPSSLGTVLGPNTGRNLRNAHRAHLRNHEDSLLGCLRMCSSSDSKTLPSTAPGGAPLVVKACLPFLPVNPGLPPLPITACFRFVAVNACLTLLPSNVDKVALLPLAFATTSPTEDCVCGPSCRAPPSAALLPSPSVDAPPTRHLFGGGGSGCLTYSSSKEAPELRRRTTNETIGRHLGLRPQWLRKHSTSASTAHLHGRFRRTAPPPPREAPLNATQDIASARPINEPRHAQPPL